MAKGKLSRRDFLKGTAAGAAAMAAAGILGACATDAGTTAAGTMAENTTGVESPAETTEGQHIGSHRGRGRMGPGV